ncbi:hypothetical protein I4U23_008033 [Adineta vaga]|nr:hypothetical protein I4U23_008033 [Adineta vaga]
MSSFSVQFMFILLSCLFVLPSGIAALSADVGGGIGGGIAGLIILILDIIAIVDILKSSRDIVGKLLWILLIIFFPLGGLIIWCLCGRKTSDVI